MNISKSRVQVVVGAATLLVVGAVTWQAWPAGHHPAQASTAAATCPATNSRKADNPPNSDLTQALVPGHPSGATVCGYTGDPTVALTRSTTIGHDQAEQLAASLNAGKVLPVHESSTCPKDDGTGDRVIFGYPSGRTVTVVIERTGCRFAANGFDPPDASTTVWMTVDAQQQLAALVG